MTILKTMKSIVMNSVMSKYLFWALFAIYIPIVTVSAGQVTDTFTAGDQLTSQSLTNIKDAINDNDTRLGAIQSQNQLIGTYKVTQAGSLQDVAYIKFDASNFYTAYIETGQSKFRSVRTGVYMAINNQIKFSQAIAGWDLANFSVSQLGELSIVRPNSTTTAILSSDDLSDWVVDLNILDSISINTESATDLAWDGTYMWHGNAYGGTNLFTIDTSTRVVTSDVATTDYAWGIERENNNVWLSSNGSSSIKRYTISGNVLTLDLTVDNLGPWVNAIAWDGSTIWAYSQNNQTISRFNPSTPTILNIYNIGFYLNGMGFFLNDLFVVTNNAIHRLDPITLVAKASYRIVTPDNNYSIEGIAWDGTSIWVSASEYVSGQSNVRLLKLDFVP